MYENVNFHFLFQLDWIIPFYSYVICFDLNSVYVASSGGSFETENQQALPQSIKICKIILQTFLSIYVTILLYIVSEHLTSEP